MKLYIAEVWVRSYCITAIGETPRKCINALVAEFKKSFGSFVQNGFLNKADWLDYHGIDERSCIEISLNSAVVK